MHKSNLLAIIVLAAGFLSGCKIDFVQQNDDEKLIGLNNTTYFIDDNGNIFEQKDGYFIEIPKFYLKTLNSKKEYKIFSLGGLPITAEVDLSYRDNRVFFDVNARVDYESAITLKPEKMSWSENCAAYDVKLVWSEQSPDKSFSVPLEHSKAAETLNLEVPEECLASPQFEQAYGALYDKAVAMVSYNQRLEGVVNSSNNFFGTSAPFRSITLLFQESNMTILEADMDYYNRLTRNVETIDGFTSEGSIRANPADFIRINGVHYSYRSDKDLTDLIKDLDKLKEKFD